MSVNVQLTPRQKAILRHVVEEYVESGHPVGSKTLVERGGLDASPSTVRAELAELENLGLLTHPHTSAGRVPTESGDAYFKANTAASRPTCATPTAANPPALWRSTVPGTPTPMTISP